MDNVKVMFCMPSKFAKEEPGTIVKVMGEGEAYSLYIQASPTKDSPEWIEWGIFLGIALDDRLSDAPFISHCLTEFHKKRKSIV